MWRGYLLLADRLNLRTIPTANHSSRTYLVFLSASSKELAEIVGLKVSKEHPVAFKIGESDAECTLEVAAKGDSSELHHQSSALRECIPGPSLLSKPLAFAPNRSVQAPRGGGIVPNRPENFPNAQCRSYAAGAGAISVH